MLMQMPQAIVLDNLSGTLDSAAVSSALTATFHTDRVLGTSRSIRVPVKNLWLATGNNVQLSAELSRRSIPIRLDAKVDRPWQRDCGFNGVSGLTR